MQQEDVNIYKPNTEMHSKITNSISTASQKFSFSQNRYQETSETKLF